MNNLKIRLLKNISKYQDETIKFQGISYIQAGRTGDKLTPYLIPKNSFIDFFDLYDLLELKGSNFPFEETFNTYNQSWFNEEYNCFEIPEFSYNKDFNDNLNTRIQTGRRRLIVFLRFLDFIPISHNETLSVSFNIPSDWKKILTSQIQIPEFEIKELGISGMD